MPSPETEVDNGTVTPQWREVGASFGHTLPIVHGYTLEVQVCWSPLCEAYIVSFAMRILKQRYKNLEEAKAAGIQLAIDTVVIAYKELQGAKKMLLEEVKENG